MKRFILVLLVLSLGACNDRGMETRTYELSRMTSVEATTLLTPYIRDGGLISGQNKLITVRETPERLTVIEDLLRKFDGIGEARDVALHMQVIWANGYEERDSAIADIEGTLREMFNFRGYRLAGEVHIRAREDSQFEQRIPGYTLHGEVQRIVRADGEPRLPIEILLRGEDRTLAGTVTATLGKPVVLGQSGGGGAIILVIRATMAGT